MHGVVGVLPCVDTRFAQRPEAFARGVSSSALRRILTRHAKTYEVGDRPTTGKDALVGRRDMQ